VRYRRVTMESEEKEISVETAHPLKGKHLLEQLREVFDACDTEGQGFVSLEELANISRSHVARGQVDQVLEILGPGKEGKDTVDFDEFYLKFVEYMRNGIMLNNDNGVFNENLKRAFEKDDLVSKSPSKKLIKRRPSQARQSGRIPLVNTSSEDEAEDSFDRKIASSLALARPMDIQPHFLVRGSLVRSTVRRTPNTSPTNSVSTSNNISTSTRRYSITSNSKSPPASIMRMSPILAPSVGSSFNSPSGSSPPSPGSRAGSPTARLSLNELERKVAVLSDMVERQVENDSVSSGIGSARTELEEDINSSILLARKHGEERLQEEKMNHADSVRTLERERDMERRNFQLRFEQLEEEQERMKKVVEELKGKLNSVNLEKDHMEKQLNLLEDEKIRQVLKNDDLEKKRKDKEELLMNTVQKLTVRIQTQDQDLAETKEDNIVLRSQVKHLKEERIKDSRDGGRYKLFGGAKGETVVDNNSHYDDPIDIRKRLKSKEEELTEQVQVNLQLKKYVDKVLISVMATNPQILENVGQLK